jgi:hypothetical protein
MLLPQFGGMSPKELRAMARQLNAMAQTLEMAQDPQKFMQKKMKSQVNGVKRKIRNQALKGIGI